MRSAIAETEQQRHLQGSEPEETLAALRRFARVRPPVERCELCGTELDAVHPHLLDRRSRKITCACNACAILFCGQQGTSFLRVPRRVLRLRDFAFSDLQWDGMMLPINLAFFVRRALGETRVMYPSPAGAMESMIALPSWKELFSADRSLAAVEPEVEALLVNRLSAEPAYFIVPIDACYRLVGLICTSWRGLSGGVDVWSRIAEFFCEMDGMTTDRSEADHA